jgi:hypothetical protein
VRKLLLFVFAILALLCVAAAAFLWADELINSIYAYRSPLKALPAPTVDTQRPLASQVVLVVIDGLRFDVSFRMPNLNALRQQGAHAALSAHPPSSAQTAWTAIVSGAGPEINDAPIFDHSLEWVQPIATDHLFAAIHRAGLTSGIAASKHWEKLVARELLYNAYFATAGDATADERVLDNAVVFLNEFRPNFLLVHLQQLEMPGQQYGGASTQYQQSAMRCDEYIQTLAANMDLTRSVLVVVGSYGHLDGGGHGGDESTVLTTPFVMIGRNVLPGDYGQLRQIDLAPTIAALLGSPVPSAAQGRMQLDMLTMNAVDRAEKSVSLASQRVRLGSIYRYSIGRGSLGETAEGDMLVALSSLQVKNYESAAELASLSVQETDHQMEQARRSRIWAERTQRGASFAAAALTIVWLLWRSRNTQGGWSVLAAILSASLYHLLFLRQGNAYSFSRIPAQGLAATVEPSLRRAAIALVAGALVMLWRVWRERERSTYAVVMRTYGYAGLQLCVMGLFMGACYWWNGPQFSWYLASFTIAYVHFTLLLQAMLVAALAIPLPIATAILHRVLLLVTDRYSTTARKARRATHSG